ncbi:MAG: helix-turn-helix domain-containing protein, partial [Erysipelotrichaceae bacterium]|nr:helix-turn-helix domain-containing protein [Erysipelotrichaceae bacterium]
MHQYASTHPLANAFPSERQVLMLNFHRNIPAERTLVFACNSFHYLKYELFSLDLWLNISVLKRKSCYYLCMNTEQKILEILMHTDQPLASKDLAFQLGTSDKTALKYLNMLKQELAGSGADIEIRQRSGSVLLIQDQQKFSSFCSRFYQKDLFNDPMIRSRYILMRLLLDSSHLDGYVLAEDIGISPGTLRSIIRSLKPVLQKYNLSLHRSHLDGYRISGKEEDIRHCLSREGNAMFIENTLVSNPYQGNLQSSLHQMISDALQQFNIAVS